MQHFWRKWSKEILRLLVKKNSGIRMEENMSRQKRQADGSAELAKTVLLSFFALVAAVAIGHFAMAEETLLTISEKTIYAGDSVDIPSCFSEEKKAENITYELKEDSGDRDSVEVSEDGTVKAVKEGTVQVTVSYTLPESPVAKQEFFTVKVLAPQEYSAVYGEVLPAMEAWNYYSPEKYEVIFSHDSLDYKENRICVEGLESATASLKRRDGKGDAFEVAKVTVQAPSFASEKYARAVGTEDFAPEILNFLQSDPGKTYQQDVLEAGKIQWKIGDAEADKPQNDNQSGGSQDSGQTGGDQNSGNQSGGSQDSSQTGGDQNSGNQSGGSQNSGQTGSDQNSGNQSGGSTDADVVAKVTEKGFLAVKVGSVKVSAVLTAKNGDKVSIEAMLFVTDPVLKESQLVLAKGVTKPLVLQGTCEVSTIVRAKTDLEADGDLAYLSTGLNVYAAAKGTIDISIIVDGKVLTAHIIVTNPKFSSSSEIMYKKQSKTVKLKGLNSTYSTVVFSSSNKKIATVSNKGVVKAKKSGRVRIYAQVDGKKIYVLVEVSSKAGYKASKKAIAISKTKTKYSQWRRMRKGYYDCSSLVSRAYRPYGVYFGVKKGWSPTAAAIGKWCARNKKVLSRKAVSYKKLLPGDIVCYSYTRNGRYRNISHIEIYVGNGKNVSASSRNNRVIHYAYKNGSTVLVARPKK